MSLARTNLLATIGCFNTVTAISEAYPNGTGSFELSTFAKKRSLASINLNELFVLFILLCVLGDDRLGDIVRHVVVVVKLHA